VPDFVVASFKPDASRRPELEVTLLDVPPEFVKPETSVWALLFLPEPFCATLLEEPRATLVPDDLLCPY
jgi:hypothetical protein